MADYSVMQDLLETFRSSSDFIKCVWLLTPASLIAISTVSVLLFRRYWQRPIVTVNTEQLGLISIYETPEGLKVLEGMAGGLPKLEMDG